jgi:integrase
MGLGPLRDVGLAEAREAAGAARKLVKSGVDPIDHRDRERSERGSARTFEAVAAEYIAAHVGSWRNLVHRHQWGRTLETYAFPALGSLPVAAISTADILRVLAPIWTTRSETANRLRGRIESILDYAIARGWRTGENPARWRGHMQNLLPARRRLAGIEHHAALPWREIGNFMGELRAREGVAALAMQFLVLTATRTSEVLGARWGEVGMTAAVWTVPAERVKAGRAHRIPLSDAALAVLMAVAPLRENAGPEGFVFPGTREDKPLAVSALRKVLQRTGRSDVTVHGFRSTFRDWAAEAAGCPRDVAEAALAHALRDRTEAAYQRGDLIERRRLLMMAWADFCVRRPPAMGDVVLLHGAAAG